MQYKALKFNNNSPIDFIIEFRTTKNPNIFFKKYNIINNPDGSIYDLDLKKKFECIYNWAKAITI